VECLLPLSSEFLSPPLLFINVKTNIHKTVILLVILLGVKFGFCR